MAISFKGAKKYKKHNGYSPKLKIRRPLPSPMHFYPLMQNGFILTPSVKEGDYVKCGQKIADFESFGSLPLISSVSGKVSVVTKDTVVIENDLEYTEIVHEPPTAGEDTLTTRETLWILREAGVTEPRYDAPLHVLLAEKTVRDCIIVCCFNSDPYVSSPQAAALLGHKKIMRALKTAMELSGINKAYIAVENDTRKIYYDFKEMLRYNTDIELYMLKARYPQSDETPLVKTITGKAETNALILSPETLINMADALEHGTPVTRKIVTVSGDDILEANNFLVPIGASFSTVLESGGYIRPEIVIDGGIFRGKKITDLDEPVTKNTSAILAFKKKTGLPSYAKKLV